MDNDDLEQEGDRRDAPIDPTQDGSGLLSDHIIQVEALHTLQNVPRQSTYNAGPQLQEQQVAELIRTLARDTDHSVQPDKQEYGRRSGRPVPDGRRESIHDQRKDDRNRNLADLRTD